MRQIQKKPCICRVNSSFELSMKQWDGSDGSYVSYSNGRLTHQRPRPRSLLICNLRFKVFASNHVQRRENTKLFTKSN